MPRSFGFGATSGTIMIMHANIHSPPEIIIRIILAINLAGLIVYMEWTYLIFIPFYILATALAGYDPLKAVLLKWRKRQ